MKASNGAVELSEKPLEMLEAFMSHPNAAVASLVGNQVVLDPATIEIDETALSIRQNQTCGTE